MNEINIIKREFTNVSDLVLFDVGASNFADSFLFRQHFPQAIIYAFEPDKDNIEAYTDIAKRLNIKVIPAALSDKDSQILFYPSTYLADKPWKFSGSIYKPVTKEGTMEGLKHDNLLYDLEGYMVMSIRLDTYCTMNNITKVDYMHIDVQGAELAVLSALGDIRPRLIMAETCEFDTYHTNTSLDEFDEFMRSLNYSIEIREIYDTLYRYNG